MTDTTTTPESAAPAADGTPAPAEKKSAPKKSSGGLGGKVLAELQEIASGLGITDVQGMRKGALIDAIKQARGESPAPAKADAAPAKADAAAAKAQTTTSEPATAPAEAKAEKPAKGDRPRAESDQADERADKQTDKQAEKPAAKDGEGDTQSSRRRNQGNNQGGQNQGNQGGQNKGNQGGNQGGQNQPKPQNNQNQNGPDDEDDENGAGRRRNRRGRNRNRGMDSEPTYSDDDVLVPAAGILDILDNYAFVRTTGYLPSEQDVYVSLSMVRKWGLRRGDAITGQVRQPREGERKEKFNPMVKVESVNGLSLDDAAKRVEFAALTPVYPTERLRLEGTSAGTAARVIDLVAPIGKGQRGLVLAEPKSGRTLLLQQVATAITEANPECHVMVVVVDERPEDVTEIRRSVKGEVIASTFDRPASDHTTVAELAIGRAERLVELGHDVVVLVDGLTRLGRAYDLAAPGSHRGATPGVDAAALQAPKRFFGAARNVEDGGSLTILATATVGSGSQADEAIVEELEGTSNWELRLRRDLAARGLAPAVDVAASGTRRAELLLDPQETEAVARLRQTLADVDARQALEQLLERVEKTQSNAELLLKG